MGLRSSCETRVVMMELIVGLVFDAVKLSWRKALDEVDIVGPRSDGIISPRGCKTQLPFIYMPPEVVTFEWTKCLKNMENTVLDTLARIPGSSSAELLFLTRDRAT